MDTNTQDDLTLIKGVGAATARKLIAAGVSGFADLSQLKPGEEPLTSIAQTPEQAEAWIAASIELAANVGLPAQSNAGQPGAVIPPESEAQGGSGDPAAPTAVFVTETPMGIAGLSSDDDLALSCPLLDAALREWAEHNEEMPTALVVASRREGFRRGGIAHARAEVTHEIGVFTSDQIEQLLADPVLTARLA